MLVVLLHAVIEQHHLLLDAAGMSSETRHLYQSRPRGPESPHLPRRATMPVVYDPCLRPPFSHVRELGDICSWKRKEEEPGLRDFPPRIFSPFSYRRASVVVASKRPGPPPRRPRRAAAARSSLLLLSPSEAAPFVRGEWYRSSNHRATHNHTAYEFHT